MAVEPESEQKAKANYSGRRAETVCAGIEINQGDSDMLYSICADHNFLFRMVEIAVNYNGNKKLYAQLTTEAEDRETLKDLSKSADKMRSKLDNIPGRVQAHLHKLADEIEIMKGSLLRLQIQAGVIAARMPTKKGGRPKEKAKRNAAKQLYALFKSFSIPWTVNTWPGSNCPALDALFWIFDKSDDNVQRDSVDKYVRELCIPQTPAKNKPVKK